MKQLMIIAILLVAVGFISGCTQVPEDVVRAQIDEDAMADDAMDKEDTIAAKGEATPIDTTKSTFTFEGYAPGKSHLGSFSDFSGELVMEDGAVIGAMGVIDAATVDTGIEGLDKHLKSDDFFDVEVYPKILFTSTSITDGTMIGSLTFHGVTHTVSFPVTVGEGSLSADFLLDTTPFGMKYIAVDKEVRIAFEMIV